MEYIKLFNKYLLPYVKKFINWRKGEVWINVLKIILVITSIALFFLLFKFVIIPVMAFVFLIVLFWSGNEPVNNSVPVQPAIPNDRIAQGILHKVLVDNADILEIESPRNADKIYPVKYSHKMSINNIPFFRFIVRHKPDSDDNFLEKKELLNNSICQLLYNGYPNVPCSFYYGYPVFYVTDIGHDSYHTDNYYIDIMPVDSEVALQYVQNNQLKDYDTTNDLFSMDDKDF